MTEKSYTDAQINVLENLKHIENNIAQAAESIGKRREDITLMAVTKTVDPLLINTALVAGVRYIGENRVQEYLGKKDALHLDGVSRHLIGHLQTNKIKQIVGHVDMIQSVDSVRVAKGISDRCIELNKKMPVLVEVNIGCEYSKSGLEPERVGEFLSEISDLPGLSVQGLMAIPPICTDDTQKRKVFSQMYQLFIDIKGKNIDNIDMSILSMGMSDDYVQAILEGATMIRVGTALFGKRVY